ncbi:MAG TPA: DUF1634 domain-containing protein [Phycisphaerales bacterium]|nr:DUF1634 domain-containing protein [Phycisphaerales bacterium]HMP36820.1 DUF1634 domain-containing protein [Phycisphaerales bacterium]
MSGSGELREPRGFDGPRGPVESTAPDALPPGPAEHAAPPAPGGSQGPRAASAESVLAGVELTLARLFRAGVVVSLALIVVGVIVALRRGVEPMGTGDPAPLSFRQLADGLRTLDGEAIVDAALLLLVAIPVLRVAAAGILFARSRDRIFALLALLVLVILLGSFVVGRFGA